MCDQCPEHTSSADRSVECNTCSEGYYRTDANVTASFETCVRCLDGAQCERNSTLTTLNLSVGYWRLSLNAPEITACSGSSANVRCIGGVGSLSKGEIEGRRLAEAAREDAALFCAPDYTGPECQLCRAGGGFYLNDDSGLCHACPDVKKRVWVLLGLVLAGGCLVSLLYIVYIHHTTQQLLPVKLLRRALRYVEQLLTASGLFAKCKVRMQGIFACGPPFSSISTSCAQSCQKLSILHVSWSSYFFPSCTRFTPPPPRWS